RGPVPGASDQGPDPVVVHPEALQIGQVAIDQHPLGTGRVDEVEPADDHRAGRRGDVESREVRIGGRRGVDARLRTLDDREAFAGARRARGADHDVLVRVREHPDQVAVLRMVHGVGDRRVDAAARCRDRGVVDGLGEGDGGVLGDAGQGGRGGAGAGGGGARGGGAGAGGGGARGGGAGAGGGGARGGGAGAGG